MSQIQPAGGRLLQSLQNRMSPSTQQLFAGSSIVPPAASPIVNPPELSVVPPIDPLPANNTAAATDDLAEADKLAIFDEVLQQVESDVSTPQQTIVTALDPSAVYTPSADTGIFAQAIPAAVTQAQQQLQQEQPSTPSGRPKEHLEGGNTIAAPELPTDIQYVEEEKSPELPPEVESYIQHVEQAAQIEPQNIVVAVEQPSAVSLNAAPPRIVKVLPLTKAQEEMGLKKNPSFSIRWLVEFGHKIAKALVGQVVYREN